MAIPKLLKETRKQLTLNSDDNMYVVSLGVNTENDNAPYVTVNNDGGITRIESCNVTTSLLGALNSNLSPTGLAFTRSDTATQYPGTSVIFAPVEAFSSETLAPGLTDGNVILSAENGSIMVHNGYQSSYVTGITPAFIAAGSQTNMAAIGDVAQTGDVGVYFMGTGVAIESNEANKVKLANISDNTVQIQLSNIADPVNAQDVATKNYVDTALESAGGTFYAIYQQTTYQEILDAYKAGKSIVCVVNGVMFYMYDAPVEDSTTDTIYFYSPYSYNQMGERVKYVQLTASNTWNGIYISTLNNFASSKYYNGETLISSSTGYYRPIRVSMSAPTASDGNVGDIWVVYSNS